MMLQELSYFLILGRPVIFYLGLITFVQILAAAAIAVLNRRGSHAIPFRWHPRVAAAAIACACIHGLFGMLLYL